jgi:hypothetical protein
LSFYRDQPGFEIVLGGNVPLDVLGRNVDEYIRTGS